MSIRIAPATCLILAAALQSSVARADEAPRLSHNPFARPPSEVTVPIRTQPGRDGATPELDLRATMVATNSKLANVGGRTVRPGDDVQGYTLLQVFEDRAVFSRGDKRLTIYTKPDPEEDDE
jgi:hypothetical protein